MVYIPDTRGVRLSPFGQGNLKIGMGVYTYSKLPGLPENQALGINPEYHGGGWRGTCPGASTECQSICYAARPVEEMGPVASMWLGNSMRGAEVPPIPADAKLLRLHVSGDFDSNGYINNWRERMIQRPDVRMWCYTRSWRVPALIDSLELLRALPNVQMFASMDKSITEVPPSGWRRAWIDGDLRAGEPFALRAHLDDGAYEHHNATTFDGDNTYLCPEQTKRKKNCVECGYCIDGKQHDVTFLNH